MQSLPSIDHAQVVVSEPVESGGKADLAPQDLAPKSCVGKGDKVRAMLRARLGEDIYTSWFAAMEFDSFDGRVVRATVPVKFLKSWIQSHYADDLLECCAAEFEGAERIDLALRQPGLANGRPMASATAAPRSPAPHAGEANASEVRRVAVSPGPGVMMGRTHVNGFEGSPLDPRYTFESFVVGPANRLAHAAATQVAETVLAEDRGFNPLYLHSSVGLGKTHLQHAIAWEVKRRTPKAQVLYLTAERFRYQFVEAIKAQDGLAFKEKFRSIDILLIDDLEFMRGEKTEQEFEHIINSLLDGGRQVVVASARPPGQLDGLNDRMRSRLQRGLITEISSLDPALRLQILEKRTQEKRSTDPSFSIPGDVVELLADRLTESGRELEGAINRLYLTWQLTNQDRGHPAHRVAALRRVQAGHPVGPPASVCRAPASGRHVSRQASDLALTARDRPPVRQSRSHNGAARDPQDRS
jgi:chromosomal replication initiator protein